MDNSIMARMGKWMGRQTNYDSNMILLSDTILKIMLWQTNYITETHRAIYLTN